MSFDIRLDGKPLKFDRVEELKPGIDMKMAQQHLSSASTNDGLDTYGLQAGDRNLVVGGQGFNTNSAIFHPDRFTVNGAPAHLKFVENERNTPRERFHPGETLKRAGSLMVPLTIITGIFGFIFGEHFAKRGMSAFRGSILWILLPITLVLALAKLAAHVPGGVNPDVISKIAK